jgi:pyruvate/2-oxoglutarate dehydrogenase complex dihydrolipoamide acyltransferase (E2) component
MSDPNEPPEATQQGDRSAQGDTERRVEATEAAQRKAQELGVDLASVEGTGSGGRITATDVENAPRQTDTTAGSTETRQRVGVRVDPTSPNRDDIHMQYVVLKATLAGPNDRTKFPLKIIREDGIEEIIGRGTFRDNPSSFFAPEPRTRAQPVVKWVLPEPQRSIPRTPGTHQRCRREECLPDRGEVE